MRVLNNIALILAIIGGINWGSIGLFKFDIVAWICGGTQSLLELSMPLWVLLPCGVSACCLARAKSQKNKRKKTRSIALSTDRVFMSALLIFPGSRPPSIVSVNELNYRVRDGNGWTLITISTDCVR